MAGPGPPPLVHRGNAPHRRCELSRRRRHRPPGPLAAQRHHLGPPGDLTRPAPRLRDGAGRPTLWDHASVGLAGAGWVAVLSSRSWCGRAPPTRRCLGVMSWPAPSGHQPAASPPSGASSGVAVNSNLHFPCAMKLAAQSWCDSNRRRGSRPRRSESGGAVREDGREAQTVRRPDRNPQG